MSLPVTILSGFLGAGKTTLLNHLLKEEHGLHIGVLVNDFGDINVDAELVEAVDDDVMQLANGCICCTIREDLVESIEVMINREDCPDHLIIEASGVADPSAIGFTFLTPGIREIARLDAVITVVDCEQILAEYPEEVQVLRNEQVQAAHIVVLNKVGLVDEAVLNRVKAWVADHSPKAMQIETENGQVPAGLLLDVNPGTQTSTQIKKKAGAHAAFETWSFTSSKPIHSLRTFNHVMEQLPEGIVRVKGWLYLADMPAFRVIVHRVGKRTDVFPGKPWGDEVRETALVAIGVAGTPEPAGIKKLLQ